MPEGEGQAGYLFAADLRWVEGPVCVVDGGIFVTEMAPERACITHISHTGAIIRRFPPMGRPTGLAIDGDGNFWIAEGLDRTVVCLSPDGHILRTIGGTDGLLWPNDLAFGPDGHLYLTDSGILGSDFMHDFNIRPDWATAPYDGRVFDIDPTTGAVVRRLDCGIKYTNGIAFGPDNLLYVNETVGGAVFRYDVLGTRMPEREPFGNVGDPLGGVGWAGPDGMAFGSDGLLYVAVFGAGEVAVLDRGGAVVERIPTLGRLPTNVAFPRDGSSFAYVTQIDGAHVEVIRTRTGGLGLHEPKGLINPT